jgi:hypothetical protein
MITYDWTFPQFVIEPSIDGLTNVVTAMVWMCTGVDSTDGANALNSGRVELKPPVPQNFVPFDQITQQMALGWLAQYINMQAVEQGISRQIERQRAPVQPINPPFVASSS